MIALLHTIVFLISMIKLKHILTKMVYNSNSTLMGIVILNWVKIIKNIVILIE